MARTITTRPLLLATGLSVLIGIAAACSGSDDTASPEPADSTPIETETAPAPTDAPTTEAPTTVPVVESTIPQIGTVSFRTDVMPVIEQNCAACHNPGAVGSHEWELAVAADVADAASDIDLFTSTALHAAVAGLEGGLPLAHDRSLTDEEIQAITDWMQEGANLDVEPDAPIEPPAGSVEPFDADIELALAEPYEGSLEKKNDYRCFLVDPQLTETTWVTGYEFQADVPEVVHHALAFHVADPDHLAGLQARDAADPGNGWGCDGGAITRGQFMAWARARIRPGCARGSACGWTPVTS